MNLGILLTEGPFQTSKSQTVSEIAKASLRKGHKVEIFLFLDGVYNVLSTQEMPTLSRQPVDDFKDIIDLGGKVIACGVCVAARGLEKGKNFIENAKILGLPQLSEMIDRSDRFISF